MANVDYYQQRIQGLLDNPDSFKTTPGYQFGLDTALQGAQRGMSRMRGSGNVLAELAKVGSGYAAQEYGNQIDRLTRLSGQEQQYGLGQEQNANTAQNNRWNYDLGQGQLALGNRNAGINERNNQMNFGLGLGNLANRNWQTGMDYDLGRRRLDNDFALGNQSNATNWFNAVTNRGNVAGNQWYNQDRSNQGWYDRFFA